MKSLDERAEYVETQKPNGNGKDREILTDFLRSIPGFDIGPKGGIRYHLHNLLLLLDAYETTLGSLRYDAFAGRIVYDGGNFGPAGEWSDYHQGLLHRWLCEMGFARFKDSDRREAVLLHAKQRGFNPLTAYLDGLVWDGQARIEQWIGRTFSTPLSPYVRTVSAKFLISAAARAYEPGCKVDTMLVFVGDQGVGKSTAVKILAGDFATETLPELRDKAACEHLRGRWMVEVAELDSFFGEKLSKVKAFVSTRVDRFRESYAKYAQDYPRTCVFFGTTNEAEFLRDTTGNRRFWPVDIPTDGDLAWLQDNRDQLFAESVHRYRSGEPWWLDKAGEKLASEEQEKRRVRHPWETRIARWLMDVAAGSETGDLFGYGYVAGPVLSPDQWNENDLSGEVVLTQALKIPLEKQGRSESTRVGRIMRMLGFEHRRVRYGDDLAWRYHRRNEET